MNEVQAFYRLAYNKEPSDCTVRALAVTCAAPYEVAHAAMHFAGRGPCQAASQEMVRDAVRSLGKELRPIVVQSKTLRTLCRELADEPGAFLVLTSDHAVGFWDGECIDWARDRLMRIRNVFAVGESAEQ